MNAMWLRSGTLAAVVVLSAPVAYARVPMQTGGGAAQPSHPAKQSTRKAGELSERHQHDFVTKLAQANVNEIELGKIAVQKASSPEVKKYAQMLVDDHTKSNQDLMPVAQQIGVKMPTELDKKSHGLADKLAKLQGAEFDREYIRAMVADHQADIREVKPVAAHATATGAGATGTSGKEKAGAETSHRVAEIAADTMPVLEKHLEQGQQLEKTVGGKHK